MGNRERERESEREREREREREGEEREVKAQTPISEVSFLLFVNFFLFCFLAQGTALARWMRCTKPLTSQDSILTVNPSLVGC